MPERLYLDTARLGLISPSAKRVLIDFARLAGEDRSPLYCERFLQHGIEAWSPSIKTRYPGLRHWRGVRALKDAVLNLAGVDTSHDVLLANRSAQLVRLGARLLFQQCRRVLVTDLCWPSYLRIVRDEAKRAGANLVPIALRRMLLRKQATLRDLEDHLDQKYHAARCDGIFTPQVTHDGVRFPLTSFIERTNPRFVLVDGAQALAHVPQLPNSPAFYVAGAHKWLRGHLPMGLALFPEELREVYCESISLDDPLLQFVRQLESRTLSRFSETVNVHPMITLSGAINDRPGSSIETSLSMRLRNADLIARACRDSSWEAIRPARELRTGILLLGPRATASLAANAAKVRSAFYACGITITAYSHGIIRFSMPDQALTSDQLRQIRRALVNIAISDRKQNAAIR